MRFAWSASLPAPFRLNALQQIVAVLGIRPLAQRMYDVGFCDQAV